MPKLVQEQQTIISDGKLRQCWRVGPVELTLDITSKLPFDRRHFDELECSINHNCILESGIDYDDANQRFPKFSALCVKQNIPFAIGDSADRQSAFFVPVSFKLRFLEALERKLADEQEA